MAKIEVHLLGRFVLEREGCEITRQLTDTGKALLALLASEPGRTWPRGTVAEMLWPDRRPGGALGNLRHTLSLLRRALDEADALVTDRTTISFASGQDAWVDLEEFEELAAAPPEAPGAVAAWQRASDLWRGDFLEDLHPTAGAEWEDWKRSTAEHCRRSLVAVLRHLADRCEQAGDSEGVIDIARRLIEIDPWDERSHRRLMEVLAARGEHSLATAHYTELERRLQAELRARPSPQTAVLADRIRAGRATPSQTAVGSIPEEWLSNAPAVVADSPFVARENEMSNLAAQLDVVHDGSGRFVLIAGEAGSGKTTLMNQFMRNAADVRTVSGRCNAFGGLGDPYLPFREALSLLAGDVEPGLNSGTLTTRQAAAIWDGMALVATLIGRHGPHLLGVMIDGVGLIDRLEKLVPNSEWLADLRSRVEMMRRNPGTDRVQPALFDECTAVLGRAAEQSPIVLAIDDLQWADAGSTALLWHLVRRLDRLRILLIGAYRPEEISSTVESPTLSSVLRELSVHAHATIELGDDRRLVDALIDTVPNELDANFRSKLFSFTGGHALFTTEMLRGMEEREEIAPDPAGIWVAQESLSWDTMPQRLEAAIERRVRRLPDDVLTDLSVASVQGEQFVAEVAAAAGSGAGALIRLDNHATSHGRIIEPLGVDRIGDRLTTRFRFRHSLFQHYLYGTLDAANVVRLHEATARELEKLYGDHPELPVVDLAYHFDRARLAGPAIEFLDRAALRARNMGANEEAIRLLERALQLLRQLPESPERDEREVELLVLLAAPINIARGWGTPQARAISGRIRQLSDRVQPSIATALALIRLASAYVVAGRFVEATAWSKKSLAMAETIGNPTLRSACEFEVGSGLLQLGEYDAALQHLRTAFACDPDPDPAVITAYGADPTPQALGHAAFAALERGRFDQAHRFSDLAVAMARRRHHLFTLCHALFQSAAVRLFHGDYDAAGEAIAETAQLAAENRFPYWEAQILGLKGQLIAERGDCETGIDLIRRKLAHVRDMGIVSWLAPDLSYLAELEYRSGRHERALQVIHDGRREVDPQGEPVGSLMLELEYGRLLRLEGDEEAAQTLHEVLAAAETLGIRSFALMAATELALLLEAEGLKSEARDILAPRYEWFTEGFDTPLLTGTREVLARL